MTDRYYITTPIYYVNDRPHIGHAYTSVACDVLARFMRLDGADVMFLTGTDEHGQKVEKSAAAAGKNPQEFVDEVSVHFREMTKLMNLSNDDFIRTTEERHKKSAQEVWNLLKANGQIYLGSYAGWYSVRDEAYYQESELIEGKAPTGAPVEWVEEPSYFFKLSEWQDKLLAFYDAHPDFIAPASRRNEVISFVKGGLKDLSISRTTFSWGIPVPGDDKHIMYVWLDALVNYISAIGFPDQKNAGYTKFWPADIHMVGKDILRFHAVYWPAFLMGAGLEPPKRVFAHGWWTIEGEKMSKSLGNVVAPADLVEQFGLDQTRYFLMREVPFGNDGNFSRAAMITRINAELANNVGNLIQRTMSVIYKNCDAKIPEHGDFIEADLVLQTQTYTQSYPQVKEAMQRQEFHKALDAIVALAVAANRYIDEQAPWALKKTDPERMGTVLYTLAESIRVIALLLQPFMPESGAKILDLLKIDASQRSFAAITRDACLKPGDGIEEPKGIFPRYQEDIA